MRVIGIDYAWREASDTKDANETGLVALDPSGTVIEAGWAQGQAQTIAWVERLALPDTLLMIDAPLVVTNATGQRLCEKQVGQRYGRWKVAANSTNLGSPRLAGVSLLQALEDRGWSYHDGRSGPPSAGRHVAEVYPYTTLVGAAELGYDKERPVYKRKPPHMRVAEFRPKRAVVCDDLIQRLLILARLDPPLDIRSHPTTRLLVEEASPEDDGPYKHREDLIDACHCAWTGLLWLRHGEERCQVLGAEDSGTPVATIIAPAWPEQRRPRGL
jgi:predicted RNase H-like nuclease